MDSQLERYIESAVSMAQAAGERILQYFRAAPQTKNKAVGGQFDPVTIADREGEELIRREIARLFPDHGIQGEEHGIQSGTSPYTWVIDPIDGTRAFILGQLHWGTLIALHDGVRPIVGVMHQPYVGETFVGSAFGAELRRGSAVTKIAARGCSRLEDAILCATDPTMFFDPEERRAFDRLAARVRMVRYGGDCYTPCLLAAGHIDLVVESSLKPWDILPLMPIVQGAGALVTNWVGGAPDAGGAAVFAANAELHAQALAVLR